MTIKNTIFEALLNRGKIIFGKEIVELSEKYEKEFGIKSNKDILKYLSRHKYIRRIFAGFYYINSFDERTRNFCEFEDKEVLFRTLDKLKIKWYVGLGYSLYLQGKKWQTPNQISIVNTRFSGLKRIFGLNVKFFKTKDSLFFGLKKMKTDKGIEYFYSDPAKTYIDRVYFKEVNKLVSIKNTKEYLKRYPKWVGKK
jgi:hypothetical protein